MEDKYMKTPKGTLSPRQEELMLFLWDKDVSLTKTKPQACDFSRE